MDGTDLYYKRRGLGLTQEELADMIGVAARTLRRWEKNEFAIPDGAAQDINILHASFGDQVLSTVDALIEQVDNLEKDADEDAKINRVVEIASFNTPESHELAHPGESWELHQALIAAVGMVLAGEGYKVVFKKVTEEPSA